MKQLYHIWLSRTDEEKELESQTFGPSGALELFRKNRPNCNMETLETNGREIEGKDETRDDVGGDE